ncbi:allene oxide cyclase barrel-like domain-containing protein [Allokutzneria oryzae]|uniref:Allene oxide cyclase barrel-like domain-containing protein n=1 Tax=Allokutzneria oryzae TaxID=1378989 RepID=A0ABV6A361_9PSEU
MRKAVWVGVSVLVGAVVVAAPAAGTTDLTLQVGNDQFATIDVGAPGLSVGDSYVYSDKLSRNGTVVGDDGGTCQVTHVSGTTATTNCVLSLRLPEGQITAQALWVRGTSPLRMAITGGTGVYRDASGELVATDIQTPKETYRVTITPK